MKLGRVVRPIPFAISLLLIAMISGAGGSWAQNENEAVGFQTNHLFESGAFGENIDILNGGLNLSIPIGPSYPVSQNLGYQLNLVYASKIWNAWPLDGKNHLVARGPAGLGFRLHMGRFYRDVVQVKVDASENECKWYFETPDGSEHRFEDETPQFSCDIFPGSTPVSRNTTFYRVQSSSPLTGWNCPPSRNSSSD